MEPSDDVYRNWAVVETGIRIYVGEILGGFGTEGHTLQAAEDGFVRLGEAFELLVVRMNQPLPDGQGVAMVQQNMHTPFPFCEEGATIHVKATAIRYFREMSAGSRAAHITFVESAKKAFAEERMRKLDIQPAGVGDLANITRRRG
jgi:hypothetical protein